MEKSLNLGLDSARYDWRMNWPGGRVLAFMFASGICSGQSPEHFIEIQLPPEVVSESVFIRYVLAGDKVGGWIYPRAGISSIVIDTMRGGIPANGMKAILYAPGCRIQTLDLTLSTSTNPPYSFICLPLPSVVISGKLTSVDWFSGRDITLEARYVARWAPEFLGIDNFILTVIPVGELLHVPPDGRFRISLADLSKDPLGGAPNHASELQIWARDKKGSRIFTQLIPAQAAWMKTPMGGLKIREGYPEEIVFAACSEEPGPKHGPFGFALRGDTSNSCDR